MSDGTARKVAVVTGAAGGIGSAVVRLLAEQGRVVAAVDLDNVQLWETVEKLAAEGLSVRGHPADVTSSADVEAVIEAVEEQLGPIDYLVNAAGVLRLGEVTDLSDQDWYLTFAVNANGVFFVSRAVVGRMMARRRGSIVTVASNAASTARSHMAAYAASKAAAIAFTKSMGLEAARYGVRCNVVAPGSTDTLMLHGMHPDGSAVAASVKGDPDAYRTGIPLGKVASTQDVAHAVLFLLSDEAGHITLQGLTVDGGATLGV
ncbi:2,3-dihydro-2,3-dihydroxybenzoate dehydrogenase [Streptomyces sp. NPDC059957]|uniref:2,3-dihydro-2,3-dihydroxybenzoate dehydrogenase n=1 Tax=unclassified Streptomyces TaxID=2593676 RepID=UPI003659E907